MEQRLAKDIGAAQDLHSLGAHCQGRKCMRQQRLGENNPVPRGPIRRIRHRPRALFWRPWLLSNSSSAKNHRQPYAQSLCENPQAEERPAGYNHPVRLFWPKSKSLDNMYQEAADLLCNFPVQATLSFYNDSESDSDNEEDNSEEECDSGFESE
ncbi:protein ripply2 [Discoglossus pictus]